MHYKTICDTIPAIIAAMPRTPEAAGLDIRHLCGLWVDFSGTTAAPKPFASTLRPSSLPRRMLSSWLCRTRGTRTRTCPVVLKRTVRWKVEVGALGRPLCPSKRCRVRRSGLGIRQLKSGGARVHVTELGRVLPAEDYLHNCRTREEGSRRSAIFWTML